MEPAEYQTDLISAVKSTEQKLIPVRVLNLSGHKEFINKNTDVGEYALVEVIINNEQPPKPAEISEKDQK